MAIFDCYSTISDTQPYLNTLYLVTNYDHTKPKPVIYLKQQYFIYYISTIV